MSQYSTHCVLAMAEKLSVDVVTVEHGVEGLMYLLTECSKLMVSGVRVDNLTGTNRSSLQMHVCPCIAYKMIYFSLNARAILFWFGEPFLFMCLYDLLSWNEVQSFFVRSRWPNVSI